LKYDLTENGYYHTSTLKLKIGRRGDGDIDQQAYPQACHHYKSGALAEMYL